MKDSNKLFSWLEGAPEKDKIIMLDINKIQSNPYQPRRIFNEEKIDELASSIKSYGLLSPVVVRKSKKDSDYYQLVAGERRLLACKKVDMKKIAAIEKDLTDNDVATIALIENLQRENLNFIEEAEGYARLINEFELTQELLAQKIGKSQSTIANKLRLLKLSDKVKKVLIANNEITERHARALLRLNTEEEQEKVIAEIIQKEMNVKQAESRVDDILMNRQKKYREKVYSKNVVRDLRIFLNTVRQAVYIIKKSGLNPIVTENDAKDYFEVIIRLPKTGENKEDKEKVVSK